MSAANESTSFQFKKSNHVSLREHVYNEIRNAIIKGQLEPGSRLNETEISNQMGVSRGPVREAIRILEQEGMIITHLHRETIVADIAESEMEQILIPSRRSFEMYAMRLIPDTFTDEHFAHLETLVAEMHGAADQDDLERLSQLDVAFHSYIIKCCVSPGMYRIWTSIAGKLHSRIFINGYKKETLQSVVEEHQEMLRLIRTGDIEQIEQHLNEHIV